MLTGHTIKNYEESYHRLTERPESLTDDDVGALGRLSAHHAQQAREIIAARTPAPRLTPELAMNGAVALLTALAQDDVLPDLSPVANGEYSPAIVARCELKANHKEFLTITDEELKHCATRDPQLAEQWAYYRREARWAQRAAKAQPPRSAPPASGHRSCLTPAVAKGMARATRKFVEQYVAQQIALLEQKVVEVERRNVELEREIAQVKAQPTLKYHGVWDPTRRYEVGSFVTVNGSIWHCETANTGMRPNASPGAWTLAVKHGADGKDAR